MCTKTANRKKVGKSGGVRALMEILRNFLKGRFDDVLEKALEALNRICTHSCNRKRVCEYGFNSLVYLLNETKQRRDIATQCVKLFATLASGANDSRTALRNTNLATLLQTIKNIYSSDNAINNEIQNILGKMFKQSEAEYENSDDSSNTDSDDFFDNLDSKSSFSLSEGLSILKNSSLSNDGSLEAMQKKITDDYTHINELKTRLSEITDTTREQEFEIQKLQKGLHSNLELVKERATLQALNRSLTKQLSQANETLADQLITTTAQKEKSTKLDQQIAELQQSMELSATSHQTEVASLNKQMCELEKHGNASRRGRVQ
jgi:molybdopterin converting factor small subunit